MYEYKDRVIKYLDKKYIAMFGKLRALASFDELNVIREVKELYGRLDRLTRQMFLKIARHTYGEFGREDPGGIDAEWVDCLLEGYDPVTKYVFDHEVERKAARCAESLIASTSKSAEVKTALRLWSLMVREYAVRVTREAAKKAYTDIGELKWRWRTVKDEKVCGICSRRNGKIYYASNYPDPPHIGCRCYPEIVRD